MRLMVISASEEELISAVRKLPPEAVEEISSLIRRLASLPAGAKVDWSDEWSDKDLRDYTAASIKNFESREED